MTTLVASLWQHPFIQNILPFATSLILHLGLIVVGLLTLQVYKTVTTPPREQIIIPETVLPMEGDEEGVLHPGAGGDPTRDAMQDRFPDVPQTSRGMAEKPGASLIPALTGGGSGAESEGQALIAAGAGGIGIGAGFGSGKGAATGPGDGDGSGLLAPFGIPGGGAGLAPRATFIGSRGAARRICYVCDASGSMVDRFDALRFEILKSIENLKPIQSFNVIFFQDEGSAAADRSDLMVANPDNKERVHRFLDNFAPRGTTNPLPSLELAFRLQPELIYILTDGRFPDDSAVLEFCRRKNAARRTRINTLAFVSRVNARDPGQLDYVKILQQLAKENGGTCQPVFEDEMGRR